MKNNDLFIFTVLFIVAALSPSFVYPVFLIKLFSFALFALSFYVLYASTGLLSFGHAAFYAAGAYGAGLLGKMGLSFELCIGGALLAGLLLAFLIGSLAIRREGIYFSMVTLAFAQLLYFILLKGAFSGGEDGLQSIPRPLLFYKIRTTSNVAVAEGLLCVLLFVLIFLHRLEKSPSGLLLKAFRAQELRAESFGYSAYWTKLNLFLLSGALAALGGALKSLGLGIASLSDAHWQLSGEVVLANLIGGAHVLAGPVLGALVMAGLEEYLAEFGAWLSFCQGFLYIVVLLFFREGLCGLFLRKPKRV